MTVQIKKRKNGHNGEVGIEEMARRRWSEIAHFVRAHLFEKDAYLDKLIALYHQHYGTETEYEIDKFIEGLPFWGEDNEEDTIQVFYTTCIGREKGHSTRMSALDILALTEENDGVNGVRLLEMMLYQRESHVAFPVDCPQCLEAREETLRRLAREAEEIKAKHFRDTKAGLYD